MTRATIMGPFVNHKYLIPNLKSQILRFDI
jgi:hypothetical protein